MITSHIDSSDRGRWAVLVGGGVLVRCRTKTEARRLRGGNHRDNPYVVRRVLRWSRGKQLAGAVRK